jgi:hypothetical protein
VFDENADIAPWGISWIKFKTNIRDIDDPYNALDGSFTNEDELCLARQRHGNKIRCA